MKSNENIHLKTHRIEFPDEFLEMIRQRAEAEDETISSLIRRVMAEYIGWSGPVRNIKNYVPRQRPRQVEPSIPKET